MEAIKKMIARERLEFYENNLSLVREMLDWFKIDGEGMRCVAIRPDNVKYPYVYRDNRSKYAYALRSLREDNFVDIVGFARTLEFITYIFDKEVMKCMRKGDVENYIIGTTAVIDIDTPDIDENDSKKGRYDLLDESGKWIEYINMVLGEFKDKLNDVGEWDNCKLVDTGNGANVVLKGYYGSTREIYEFFTGDEDGDGLLGLMADVKKITGCNIHLKKPGWQFNNKVPNTLHFHNNRIVLEMEKNKEWKLDDLVERSNPFNEKIYNVVGIT